MEIFNSIVLSVFIVVGLILCIRTIRNAVWFHNENSFPSVLGAIKLSKVMEYHRHWWQRTAVWEGTSYCAEVVYTFIVDGISYKSTDIDFGVHSGSVYLSKEDAQKIVDKYPRDSQVKVYYKPNNPKYSALEMGATKTWTIMGILVGFAFIAIGAGLMVYIWT